MAKHSSERSPITVKPLGVRYHRHFGDGMSPTIKNNDRVVIVIVDRWSGDGIYLFDDGGQFCIFRCQRVRGEVMLMNDNKVYQTQTVPQAWFDEHVAAKVVATMHLIDSGAGFTLA
jgi:phage repressor protein C with HTH and peptisase S24 domain